MERQIAFDKLAREDRFVRMRAREVAESKIGQGLAPFPELTSRESIKERAHGIMVGEMQAMEGAGRSARGGSPTRSRADARRAPTRWRAARPLGARSGITKREVRLTLICR